jgi:hypothetical protein
LVAVASSDLGGNALAGSIFISGDSGANWTQASAPSNGWLSVASSADGTKLVAVNLNYNDFAPWGALGSIYISTNSGVTWTPTTAPANGWSSVTSSTDGTRLTAAGSPEGIYVSTDSGATWMQASAPGEVWSSVASSADGNKVVAVANSDLNYDYYGGPIYTLQHPIPPPTPLPKLNISLSDGNFDISWLVPSTSFVLQQNSDLTTTNWVDVSSTPSLNYTNLNYQVTVSPTNGQGFYRLEQQ